MSIQRSYTGAAIERRKFHASVDNPEVEIADVNSDLANDSAFGMDPKEVARKGKSPQPSPVVTLALEEVGSPTI